jgi:hypothetical protein
MGKLEPETPIFDGKNHGFSVDFPLNQLNHDFILSFPIVPG